MRFMELLQILVGVWADPVWILPAVLLAVGLVAGVILAISLRPGERELATASAELTRLDLEKRRDTVIEAIRALDLERDKLSPEDYEREKRALLGHGAQTLRALEGASEGAVADEEQDTDALIKALAEHEEALGRPTVAAIVARLTERETPPPPSEAEVPTATGLPPVWQGALVVLAGLAALLLVSIGVRVYNANMAREAEPEQVAQQAPARGQQRPPAATRPELQPSPEEQAWMTALESNPDDLEALNGLTDFEIRRQGWEQARDYNQRALALDPDGAQPRIWEALLDYRDGNFPRAVEKLEGVIADHPDAYRAYQFRGLIHLQMGQFDDAVARFEQAIERAEDPRVQGGLRQLIGEARQARAANAPELGGTISLGEGVDPSKWGDKATLFVSAKASTGPPMPLRAKKVALGDFPLTFEIASADAPMRGGPLPETVTVTVKVDLDGNPMGDDPGAPKVTLEGVTPGTLDLAFTLPQE